MTLSSYREAESQFGTNTDELWEFLEVNRLNDPTLAIGWALLRARRFFSWDNMTVAQRTAVRDELGNLIEEPISKTFLSSLLSGKSKASPHTYKRLARVCEVSPLDFYLAEGWLDPGDVAAYTIPDRELATPVLTKLLRIPRHMRAKARAVVLAVLDSIYEEAESN